MRTRRWPGPLSTMRSEGALRVRSVKLDEPAAANASPEVAEMASGVSCRRVLRRSAVTTMSALSIASEAVDPPSVVACASTTPGDAINVPAKRSALKSGARVQV